MATYDFGKTTFQYNVWIGGGTGRNFIKPQSVHLKTNSRNNISISVVQNGKEVGRVNTGIFESSTNFPIGYIAKSGSYKIRLYNNREV